MAPIHSSETSITNQPTLRKTHKSKEHRDNLVQAADLPQQPMCSLQQYALPLHPTGHAHCPVLFHQVPQLAIPPIKSSLLSEYFQKRRETASGDVMQRQIASHFSRIQHSKIYRLDLRSSVILRSV
jgi:hypothetical protein